MDRASAPARSAARARRPDGGAADPALSASPVAAARDAGSAAVRGGRDQSVAPAPRASRAGRVGRQAPAGRAQFRVRGRGGVGARAGLCRARSPRPPSSCCGTSRSSRSPPSGCTVLDSSRARTGAVRDTRWRSSWRLAICRVPWPSWCARAGGWRPRASSTVSPVPSTSRSPRAWTGSSCTGRWSSATRRRSCPNCWARSAGARARCFSATGPTASCPRSGSGSTGCSRDSARRREDHVRFGKSQVGLLDALLASLPEARCDASLARAREELRRFEGITPRDPADGFVGRLRAYQRDGLGWLRFLRAVRLRRLPGRRHGTRQDGAGAGAPGVATRGAGTECGWHETRARR